MEGHDHVDGARARRHVLDVVSVDPGAPVDLVGVVVDLEGKAKAGGAGRAPACTRPAAPAPGGPLPRSPPTAAGRP